MRTHELYLSYHTKALMHVRNADARTTHTLRTRSRARMHTQVFCCGLLPLLGRHVEEAARQDDSLDDHLRRVPWPEGSFYLL